MKNCSVPSINLQLQNSQVKNKKPTKENAACKAALRRCFLSRYKEQED